MKVKVLMVVWHNKEPVFSLDFHPSGLLATGGADCEIKLWKVGEGEDGNLNAEFLSSITGEDTGFRSINCIRFSPTGQSLASAGDAGQIYLWKPSQPDGGMDGLAASPWKHANLGGFSEKEIVDISWASDGSAFVTASADNTCMIWDPEARRGKLRLQGHRHLVQGCAWDPQLQYLVSASADRTCRVYAHTHIPNLKKKVSAASKLGVNMVDFALPHVINKRPAPKAEQGDEAGPKGRKAVAEHLFYDESLQTFFRRLAWSPDGSMLVVPSGLQKSADGQRTTNMAYIYARGNWHTPFMQLPATPKPVVAVRFCPVIFELEAQDPAAPTLPIDLPYRMVFALGTKDSVIIYSTQDVLPLAVLGGIHLESITDLAWSPDGLQLAISSYDSYCSLAVFEPGELGKALSNDKTPAHVAVHLPAVVAQAAALSAATSCRAGVATPLVAPAATQQQQLSLEQPAEQSTEAKGGEVAAVKQPRRIAPIATLATPAPEGTGAAKTCAGLYQKQ